MTYAKDTSVPVERSRAEIERILVRWGCESFVSGWDQKKSSIGFRARDRLVRFELPLPDPNDKRYVKDVRGATRSPDRRHEAWEQDCRARWRALALVIKAKLEAVEAGICTFESEFLSHIVLPDGSTVGQWAEPQLERAYSTNRMPPTLLLGTGS